MLSFSACLQSLESTPLNMQDLWMIRMPPSFVLLSHIQGQRARSCHLQALIRNLCEHTDDVSMLHAHISKYWALFENAQTSKNGANFMKTLAMYAQSHTQ